MREYRAFILGHDNRIMSAIDIRADTDDKAVKIALQYVDGHDVELWQSARKIAVLKHSE